MRVSFIKSGTKPAEYPFPYKPEVAIVGRSNAGKSSFLNALTGQKIAKTSQTPGKTRLLNFFNVDEKVYLVDMPGYGFATGNRQEVEGWRSMIETYFEVRETLQGVLLIMDIRRDWDDEEAMLKNWLDHKGIRWGLVLNKTDKLSRSAAIQRGQKISQAAGEVPTFLFSALKKQGLEDVHKLIFKEWTK